MFEYETKNREMTGRELIEWIQEHHAEDLPIRYMADLGWGGVRNVAIKDWYSREAIWINYDD